CVTLIFHIKLYYTFSIRFFIFFFFPDTLSTVTYTLSLHDALPIYTQDAVVPTFTFTRTDGGRWEVTDVEVVATFMEYHPRARVVDRKSTRLNSSHVKISYAVFCLKKKKTDASL